MMIIIIIKVRSDKRYENNNDGIDNNENDRPDNSNNDKNSKNNNHNYHYNHDHHHFFRSPTNARSCLEREEAEESQFSSIIKGYASLIY